MTTTPPRSIWDRDPETTYRKMLAGIDQDARNGYLSRNDVDRWRNAANKCYLAAKKRARR